MSDDTSSTSTPADGPARDAPSDHGTTKTAPPAPQQQQANGDNPDLANELAKWKTMSRSHEQKWQKATSEAEQARQLAAEREVALNDARTEAASALALARLEVGLARAGMPPEAAENYVKFLDPARLLKDGKPNPDAIKQLVADLPASLRTGPPDPDQGRASNNRPLDMNQVIRRAAGLG